MWNRQRVGLTVVRLHASRLLTRLVGTSYLTGATTSLASAGCRFFKLPLPNWQCVLRVEWKTVSTRLKSRWSKGKIRDVFAFGTRISHDALNSLTRPFVCSTQRWGGSSSYRRFPLLLFHPKKSSLRLGLGRIKANMSKPFFYKLDRANTWAVMTLEAITYPSFLK